MRMKNELYEKEYGRDFYRLGFEPAMQVQHHREVIPGVAGGGSQQDVFDKRNQHLPGGPIKPIGTGPVSQSIMNNGAHYRSTESFHNAAQMSVNPQQVFESPE